MTHMTILIRDARWEDAGIIADYNTRMALETENKTLSQETIQSGVERGIVQPEKCRYFVAEQDSVMVGQAMITFEWSDWRNGELWWLQSVYVHPDHRRRGVFSKLFRHIESLARQNPDVRGLRLYVEEDNAVGQSVYSSLGMVHAGYHVYEREF